MKQITLTAYPREEKGKSAVRKLRRDNHIPAIFYSPNKASVMLKVEDSALRGILKETEGDNILFGLQIDSGGKSESKSVMLKELQRDPIKDIYYHADFYEIAMDKELTVNVPIHLVNTPIGVTNGGILQHVRRELAIFGLPGNLVDSFELDVSGLDIGQSLHVADITLPEGVKTLDEDRLTVAVVAAPTVVPEEEVEEVEAEEGAEEEGKETEAEADSEASEEKKDEKGGKP